MASVQTLFISNVILLPPDTKHLKEKLSAEGNLVKNIDRNSKVYTFTMTRPTAGVAKPLTAHII